MQRAFTCQQLHVLACHSVLADSYYRTAMGLPQVQLDSGHVLPYHVVATDYDSWALMCTTSASLGGQKPAQVCLVRLHSALGLAHLQLRRQQGDGRPAMNLPFSVLVHGVISGRFEGS